MAGNLPAMEQASETPGVKEGMHHVKRFLSKFRRDESAATAIEYALIAAAIALAIIAIINGIGLHLADMLASLNAAIK